ncbi:MAG: lyso-ornithine lipid O-acyltransferase [Wenzhouxiangellaceae bacterium]
MDQLLLQPDDLAMYRRSRWRLLYRLPLLFIHLVLVLPLAALAQSRWLRDRYLGSFTIEDYAARYWSRGLLRIFGLRVRVHGQLNHDPVLILANHISWLDIVALMSLRSIRFVAKAEINRWPLIGLLVRRARTIYVKRGSSDSAQRVLNDMTATLNDRQTVAIFPEGGIPAAPGVARFRSRLLAAAQEAGVDLEPVCIRYRHGGAVDKLVTFLPGEHFMANFIRLLGGPPMTLEIFLLPRLPSQGDRRQLARQAETLVRDAYQRPATDV